MVPMNLSSRECKVRVKRMVCLIIYVTFRSRVSASCFSDVSKSRRRAEFRELWVWMTDRISFPSEAFNLGLLRNKLRCNYHSWRWQYRCYLPDYPVWLLANHMGTRVHYRRGQKDCHRLVKLSLSLQVLLTLPPLITRAV